MKEIKNLFESLTWKDKSARDFSEMSPHLSKRYTFVVESAILS